MFFIIINVKSSFWLVNIFVETMIHFLQDYLINRIIWKYVFEIEILKYVFMVTSDQFNASFVNKGIIIMYFYLTTYPLTQLFNGSLSWFAQNIKQQILFSTLLI